MFRKKGLIALLCLSLLPVLSYTQHKAERPLKLGFGLSGFGYLGDFANGSQRLQRVYPGANLSIHMDGPSKLQLQLHLGFGKFSAQYEADTPPVNGGEATPNTFVETPFYYSDLRLRYRFLKGKWQPYVAVGAGVLVFSPRDANGKPLKYIEQSRAEGEVYNTIIPELPATIGVEGRINSHLSAGIDYTFRYTPTDYLDNVGQLGARPGKDILHAITLILSFTLRPEQADTHGDLLPVPSSTLIKGAQNDSNMLANKNEMSSMSPDSSTAITPSSIKDESAVDTTIQTLNTSVPEPSADTRLFDPREVEEAIAAKRFTYYTVQPDDQLADIALKYRIPIEIIRKLNYLKSDQLKVGSYLRLPEVALEK